MPIKPISFTLHNVRKIDEITIDFPICGVIIIKGANEVGKSTLIECIRSVYTADNTTELAIGNKNGWSESRFVLPTGEEVIIRQDLSESKKGSRFVMVDPDGNVKKNIGDIKDLFKFNNFTLDEFISWGEYLEGQRKQKKIYLETLPKQVKKDFLALEEQEKELYIKRTNANNQELIKKNVVEGARPSLTDEVRAKALDRINKEYVEAEKSHFQAYNLLETQKQALIPIEKENEKLTSLNNDLTNKTNQYKSKEIFYNTEIAELERKLTEKKAEKEQELKLIKEEGLAIRKQRDEQQIKCNGLQSIDLTLLEKDEELKRELMLKLKRDHDEAKASSLVLSNYAKQVHDHKEALAEADKLNEEIKRVREQKDNVILSSDSPIKEVRMTDDGIEVEVEGQWYPCRKKFLATSRSYVTVAKIAILANKECPIALIAQGESILLPLMKELVAFAGKTNSIFLVEKAQEGVNEILVEIIEA